MVFAVVPDTMIGLAKTTMIGVRSSREKNMRGNLRSRSRTIKTTSAVGARVHIVIVVGVAAFFLDLIGTGQVRVADGSHEIIGELADVATASSSCIGRRRVKRQVWNNWVLVQDLGLVCIKAGEIVGEKQLLVVT